MPVISTGDFRTSREND